jgi:hypothetical protein
MKPHPLESAKGGKNPTAENTDFFMEEDGPEHCTPQYGGPKMAMSDREEDDDDTDANSSAHNAQNTQHINKNNNSNGNNRDCWDNNNDNDNTTKTADMVSTTPFDTLNVSTSTASRPQTNDSPFCQNTQQLKRNNPKQTPPLIPLTATDTHNKNPPTPPNILQPPARPYTLRTANVGLYLER